MDETKYEKVEVMKKNKGGRDTPGPGRVHPHFPPAPVFVWIHRETGEPGYAVPA